MKQKADLGGLWVANMSLGSGYSQDSNDAVAAAREHADVVVVIGIFHDFAVVAVFHDNIYKKDGSDCWLRIQKLRRLCSFRLFSQSVAVG